MIVGISITVIGKVQGVGFRAFVLKSAIKNQISGYVRNLPDGNVYIEAEGLQSNINEFIDNCRNGSAFSKVTQIIVKELSFKDFQSFEIRY
jgi:acylphosphatase